MTPESIGSSESLPPSGMSEVSRLTGVFFEPTKTFEDIAARPRWIAPMLLVILAGLAYTTFIGQRIGWERVVRQQVETSSRAANIPADQKERQIQIGARVASIIGYVGPIAGAFIGALLVAGVLTGVASGIMSAGVKFKQVFAVVAYASLTVVVTNILSIVVLFLKNPDDFDIKNPLMFNPGAFMDPLTSSKFIYSLASSMDLLIFWNIFLLATGIKAAAGKRLSFGGALFAVILPWAIYVFGKSALAPLTS